MILSKKPDTDEELPRNGAEPAPEWGIDVGTVILNVRDRNSGKSSPETLDKFLQRNVDEAEEMQGTIADLQIRLGRVERMLEALGNELIIIRPPGSKKRWRFWSS